MEKVLKNKKAVMIIAFRNFRDEEYFIPKSILQGTGISVVTASTQKGTAVGLSGGEAYVDILIEDLNVSDFDAVIFIGGGGALKELDSEKSYEIADKAVRDSKVLGAICISPVILAKAGVLQSKKATVWSCPLERGPVKILKEEKAIYQDESVVVDGKIVTANGPLAAKKFGETLTEMLK